MLMPDLTGLIGFCHRQIRLAEQRIIMDKLFNADTHMMCALKRADVYVRMAGLGVWDIDPFTQTWMDYNSNPEA